MDTLQSSKHSCNTVAIEVLNELSTLEPAKIISKTNSEGVIAMKRASSYCSSDSQNPRLSQAIGLNKMVWIGLAVVLVVSVSAVRASAQNQATKVVKLPDATAGIPYSFDLAAVGETKDNKAALNLQWALLDDGSNDRHRSLPDGLTLDSTTGVISGTPKAADEKNPYRFTIKVTSKTINGLEASQRLSLTVSSLAINIGRLPVEPSTSDGSNRSDQPAFVLTTSTSDEETISLTQEVAKPADIEGVEQDKLLIKDPNALIRSTVGTDKENANFMVGDYCLVHLIKWKPAKEGKSDPAKESWALFERVKKDGAEVWSPHLDPKNKDKEQVVYDTRIFGSRRVLALLIHFNTPPTWDVKYKVSINQQTPTPIANVLALAAAINPISGGAAEARAVEEPKTIWGARLLIDRYTASQIVVKVNAVTSGGDGTPVEQSKEYSKNYTNEGRYHWDVSVGVPLNSFRELQFSTDANNRVTTGSKERQNVYGFLNLFFKPVDLSGERFLTPPHLVLGVPLASKPLHHPFAGLGYGVYKTPIKFNLFAGVVFNRERVPRTLNAGDIATSSQLESDLHTRWVRKFMFGINFPISQIKSAIKK
jgi:hypothetical protein